MLFLRESSPGAEKRFSRKIFQIQWNPDFWNLQGKRKFSSKNWRVREIGGKDSVRLRRGKDFSRKVREIEGSRNRDSTVQQTLSNG